MPLWVDRISLNLSLKLTLMYWFATIKKKNRYLDFTLQYLTAGFQVVNLQHSEVQDRVMLTGRHMVRDVSCKNCNSKLGWMYEFATEESQRYKEGRVILERALVRESEGFEHVASDDSWVSLCCHRDAQSMQTAAAPLSVWMVFHSWSELRQLFVLCTIFITSTVDIFS